MSSSEICCPATFSDEGLPRIVTKKLFDEASRAEFLACEIPLWEALAIGCPSPKIRMHSVAKYFSPLWLQVSGLQEFVELFVLNMQIAVEFPQLPDKKIRHLGQILRADNGIVNSPREWL